MEMRRLEQNRGESSNVDGAKEVWNTIWGLQAPPVLHNFLWKLCNNLPPVKENLYRKKIVSDPWCPLCNCEPETSYHCLWGCPTAVAVW